MAILGQTGNPQLAGKVKKMPWDSQNASEFTKAAKTAADQKLWSAVANKVLTETGSDAQAIKIANSQVRKSKVR